MCGILYHKCEFPEIPILINQSINEQSVSRTAKEDLHSRILENYRIHLNDNLCNLCSSKKQILIANNSNTMSNRENKLDIVTSANGYFIDFTKDLYRGA